MTIRTTRTYAEMKISYSAFKEILGKLEGAGYWHCIHVGEGLTLEGIMLVAEALVAEASDSECSDIPSAQILFNKDGSICDSEGNPKAADEWLLPSDTVFPRTEFDEDLCVSMVNVGHGHDPYNHIGDDIVAEEIGVEKSVLG